MFESVQLNTIQEESEISPIKKSLVVSHYIEDPQQQNMIAPQTPLTINDPYSQFVNNQQDYNLFTADGPSKLDQLDKLVIKVEKTSKFSNDLLFCKSIPIEFSVYSHESSKFPLFIIKQEISCCSSSVKGQFINLKNTLTSNIHNHSEKSDQILTLNHKRRCFCLKNSMLFFPFIGWISYCLAQCCCKSKGDLSDSEGNVISQYKIYAFKSGIEYQISSSKSKFSIKQDKNTQQKGKIQFKIYDNSNGKHKPGYEIILSKDSNIFFDKQNQSTGEYLTIKFPQNISQEEKMTLLISSSKLL